VNRGSIQAIGAGKSPTLELLTLALPIVGMTVTRMLMGFIDFIMVSALGTDAQAAISPAAILVFTIACLGGGVAQSVQTFVSQADGRGEPHRAGGYAWQSFYVAGLCTLLVGLFALTTERWFATLAALGRHAPTVAALEVEYIRIAMWLVPAAIISSGLDGFFSGIRKPRTSLIAALLSVAANTLGNWLLIYGNLGFPRLEMTGAAIATVVGWWVRAGVLTVAMLRADCDRRYRTRGSYGFCWDSVRGLLYVGGPTSLQWIIDIGSWVVFMVLIMPPFGTPAMAATNTVMQLMHLSFMPAIGVGIALCSQVGFAIGQRSPEDAVRRTRVALRVTVGYMAGVGLLFLLARRPLIWIFNRDPVVIEVGALILVWAAIFQAFDAMGITYMNALRGAGDTRWAAAVTFLTCWGVFVGGGYAMSHLLPQYGINGPWGACTVYIIVLGLLLAWRWYRGHWRRMQLFREPPASVRELLPAVCTGPTGLPAASE